jgi:hypothetical protein
MSIESIPAIIETQSNLSNNKVAKSSTNFFDLLHGSLQISANLTKHGLQQAPLTINSSQQDKIKPTQDLINTSEADSLLHDVQLTPINQSRRDKNAPLIEIGLIKAFGLRVSH